MGGASWREWFGPVHDTPRGAGFEAGEQVLVPVKQVASVSSEQSQCGFVLRRSRW
jgi:hypothetical protein